MRDFCESDDIMDGQAARTCYVQYSSFNPYAVRESYLVLQYKHKHSSWTSANNRHIDTLLNQLLTAPNDRSNNGLSFELLKVKSRCTLMEI